MSYRIEYGKDKRYSPDKKGKGLLIAICVLVLVAALEFSGLRQRLFYRLLPGDPQVTAGALENFAGNLKAGETPGEAFSAFCREILEHGQ